MLGTDWINFLNVLENAIINLLPYEEAMNEYRVKNVGEILEKNLNKSLFLYTFIVFVQPFSL